MPMTARTAHTMPTIAPASRCLLLYGGSELELELELEITFTEASSSRGFQGSVSQSVSQSVSCKLQHVSEKCSKYIGVDIHISAPEPVGTAIETCVRARLGISIVRLVLTRSKTPPRNAPSSVVVVCKTVILSELTPQLYDVRRPMSCASAINL